MSDGIVEKEDVLAPEMMVYNVAVFSRQLLEKREGVGRPKTMHCEPEQAMLRTGRITIGAGHGDGLLQAGTHGP